MLRCVANGFEFIPAHPLSQPPAPGLQTPDEPGAFLISVPNM
jgi:hypothetical protein